MTCCNFKWLDEITAYNGKWVGPSINSAQLPGEQLKWLAMRAKNAIPIFNFHDGTLPKELIKSNLIDTWSGSKYTELPVCMQLTHAVFPKILWGETVNMKATLCKNNSVYGNKYSLALTFFIISGRWEKNGDGRSFFDKMRMTSHRMISCCGYIHSFLFVCVVVVGVGGLAVKWKLPYHNFFYVLWEGAGNIHVRTFPFFILTFMR